jgi:hypothetical protein
LIDAGLSGAAARQPAFAHEPSALAYTAPELTGPDPQFSASCDVFSIGVMLWELLTGQPLFAAATAAQTLENLHRAPIERVQRHEFVRGEPIAFALAQAVANALKRSPTQRLPDYDALMTALVQAGPIGRPEAVAELVQHSTRKESVEELKDRIAHMKQESEARATSARVTMPINKKTQTGLGPITLAPPADAHARLSAAATLPPQHELTTPSVGSSAHPTARMRRLPSAQGPISITRLANAPRTQQPVQVPRLDAAFEEQVSAFPIGDLRRNSMPRTQAPGRRNRWVPALLAAVVLLGIGSYSLGLMNGDEAGPARPTAASRLPPNAALPMPTAPSEAPVAAPTRAVPTAPTSAAPPPAAAPSEVPVQPGEDPVVEPATAAPTAQPDQNVPDAATPSDKRRTKKPEGRRGNVEPKAARPLSEPSRTPTKPSEPEPPQRKGVLKIIPTPEAPAPAPAPSAIPEDI